MWLSFTSYRGPTKESPLSAQRVLSESSHTQASASPTACIQTFLVTYVYKRSMAQKKLETVHAFSLKLQPVSRARALRRGFQSFFLAHLFSL